MATNGKVREAFIHTVAVSAALVIVFSSIFLRCISGLDLGKLALLILAMITAINLWLTGVIGLLILFTASFMGYSALLSGSRATCMAVLIVPAIGFYSTGLFLYL